MPTPRHALVAFIVIAALPLGAGAQVDASVDAGAARLLQVDLPQSDVLTVGGRLRWQGLRGSLSTSAIGAQTASGAVTAQGTLAASLYASPLKRWRWEVGAGLSSFGASSALPTVNAMLALRQHLIIGSRAGAYAGLQGGGIVLDDIWRSALVGQLGGWYRRQAHVISFSLAATATRSELRIPFPELGTVYVETNPAQYVDAVGYWQREGGRVDFELGGGLRGGIEGVPGAAIWGAASVSLWMTPRMAIVASTGRALEDIVRGLPQARYHTIALRVGLRDRVRAFTPRPKLTFDAPVLTVDRRGNGPHVITVRVPKASSVELMGDFTSWEPVTLVGEGQSWTMECSLSPGAHHIAIRIDGGEWLVPANLPKIDDDFGGNVGLLSVP
jgi:hypothetical protein